VLTAGQRRLVSVVMQAAAHAATEAGATKVMQGLLEGGARGHAITMQRHVRCYRCVWHAWRAKSRAARSAPLKRRKAMPTQAAAATHCLA